MRRRSVVLLPFLLLSCGKTEKSVESLLPAELQTWKRGDISSVPALPDGAVSGAEALYLGEGRVNVRVLQYRNETVAFEKMQQWRQSEGLAAYNGPYFFIAQPQAGASRDSAMTLLGALKNQGIR